MIPKINLSTVVRWSHHRSGWGFCMDCLSELHNPYGILTIGSVEETMKKQVLIKEPWVGFVHNVPYHPPIMKTLYGELHGGFDLAAMMASPIWKTNIRRCRGLFCLSNDVYEFIRSKTSVPITKIYHTTETPNKTFDWNKFELNKNKKILFIGHWMRNWESFFELKDVFGFEKYILKGVQGGFNYNNIEYLFVKNRSVSYLDRLENDAYDNILSKNIVFLDLLGSSANNTVVECIVRNTPIIINRTSAAEEYLGDDYPLFYDELSEAHKLLDFHKLKLAHEMLKLRHGLISPENFKQSVENSVVYQSLPTITV